jgi:hypothetical protein
MKYKSYIKLVHEVYGMCFLYSVKNQNPLFTGGKFDSKE